MFVKSNSRPKLIRCAKTACYGFGIVKIEQVLSKGAQGCSFSNRVWVLLKHSNVTTGTGKLLQLLRLTNQKICPEKKGIEHIFEGCRSEKQASVHCDNLCVFSVKLIKCMDRLGKKKYFCR